MSNRSPVAVFLAASALLATAPMQTEIANAGENGELGGLKEWTTDQDINAKSKLDKAAEKAAKKAKKNDVCIPVGEGENCW